MRENQGHLALKEPKVPQEPAMKDPRVHHSKLQVRRELFLPEHSTKLACHMAPVPYSKTETRRATRVAYQRW
jgi:protein-L-isoaspartate O-methyltransferase